MTLPQLTGCTSTVELRFLLKQSLVRVFKGYSDPAVLLLTPCTEPNVLASFQRVKRCQTRISHPCRSIKQGSQVYHRIILCTSFSKRTMSKSITSRGSWENLLRKKRLILFSKCWSYLGRLNYCTLTNIFWMRMADKKFYCRMASPR